MRIEKIPEDAVLIPGTTDEYVDRKGNIYGINHRANQPEYPFIREQCTKLGYKYAKVRGKNTRVHRVVAEVFIPNPDNLPVVMHINNKKDDNRVENLKWGTYSENTQQAVDDDLMVQDKGFDDSQSMPVDAYETTTNKKLASYGSMHEAAKATGVSVAGIRFSIDANAPIRKRVYFARPNEGPREHEIILEKDFNTEEIVNRFCNIGDAERITGVSQSTISCQIKAGKPAWSKTGTYFEKAVLKGEEIIETEKGVE